MGNRVQNYLSDLAYALDYAYTTQCCTKPTICDGQAQRLQYVTGNAVSINGQSTVVACCNNGTGLHSNDLITAVLNLRNPKNQTNVIKECMLNTVRAYNCDGQLIAGSIVERTSGQAKIPATNVCTACGCYTACGVTGTAGGNATHNCGPLTVSLPKGYYENVSVSVLGSCNRTTPPTGGGCVKIDGASQYPYSSGYLVASGDGTVVSTGNAYYAIHNYGDVAIKIPEGYYPNGYTTHMKGATLRAPSNVAATYSKQGYVCIPAGYTSGFTCCWNMIGTSTISEVNVACGCTYVDATGKLRTGTYGMPGAKFDCGHIFRDTAYYVGAGYAWTCGYCSSMNCGATGTWSCILLWSSLQYHLVAKWTCECSCGEGYLTFYFRPRGTDSWSSKRVYYKENTSTQWIYSANWECGFGYGFMTLGTIHGCWNNWTGTVN